jgi:hypothetical protein
VTCYTRHLGTLLPPSPSAEDKRVVDAAVREVLGVGPDTRCPQIWAAIKAQPDRVAFERAVRTRL